MIHTRTDGRNNTTTTVTDIAGRVLTVTDAAGNVTTTVYDSAHDLPATVTEAQGNTTCYRYDARSRKLVEWGTGIQPVCFGYDDTDRIVTLHQRYLYRGYRQITALDLTRNNHPAL